jgi:hypothetical protein
LIELCHIGVWSNWTGGTAAMEELDVVMIKKNITFAGLKPE